MTFNEVTIIIDKPEVQKRLDSLEQRLKNINGWNGQDILQFAVNGFQTHYIDVLLTMMECMVDTLENETQKEKHP